jgi:peptide/nickel transport system substrate-binding protein
VTGLGYQGITINLRNKTGKQNPPGDLGTPLANDPRVREAFELSIDREALNQVAWDGLYTPGCTPISPISRSSTRAASARRATWRRPRSSWPTPGSPAATASR